NVARFYESVDSWSDIRLSSTDSWTKESSDNTTTTSSTPHQENLTFGFLFEKFSRVYRLRLTFLGYHTTATRGDETCLWLGKVATSLAMVKNVVLRGRLTQNSCLNHAVLWGCSVLQNVQVGPANVFELQLCLGCVAETAVPVAPPPSAPSQPSPTERPPPPPTVEPIVLRERLSFNPDADAMMRTMTLHPQLSSSLRTPMASKDHSHQPQRYVVPLLEMEAANIEEGDEDEGSDDEYDQVCVDMECANGCVTLIYQGAAVLKGAFGSLRTSDGHVLGTVSVADTAPRLRMSPQHRQAMDTFHDNVVALIEDRLAVALQEH
ncbi:hypothetical protein B5M09_012632, partial [Aphanomyces astaci]